MGAWGAGSFENDTALDWADEVESVGDVEAVFTGLPEYDGKTDLEADDASRVIAAAEAVATMMGRVAEDVPEELQELLAGAEPSGPLIEMARNAVSRVMSRSELLDLWAEDEEGSEAFGKAITALVDRLNPDMSWDRPTKEEVEQQAGPIMPCVFCDEGMTEDNMFYLGFRDYTDRNGLFGEQGIYCHLTCLNAKLHPRHMVQNWKFDLR
ncbi:DUF4259 domain-containing protein [Croceicoccus naphthovorans]|uniref:DUF4259 domain-containing protein n=1 Tax=Croceicoccus naphthovorans TaxID=1348774 RepID=UPI00069CD46E|nr:DUF4259 domain-containing protein [Croceicoccus naphthovorans]MBB3991463.1 hypothetical protein [Croceicoccus naphthovorans]